MRHLFFILLFFISIHGIGQGDTINVRISERQGFPQIGKDTKGNKYFVMSTRQDKAALIALHQGLYADSLLAVYEDLQKTCDEETRRLQETATDRAKTINDNRIVIAALERNYTDMEAQKKNSDASVVDLTAQVKRQKIPMWAGIILGAVAGGVLLNKAID